MIEPDRQADQLRRLLRLQRLLAVGFFAAFACLAGGFLLGFLQPTLGGCVVGFGWCLIALEILYSFVVVPLLKCPRCGHRFFTADGLLGFLARINVMNRRCVHCGLTQAAGNQDHSGSNQGDGAQAGG